MRKAAEVKSTWDRLKPGPNYCFKGVDNQSGQMVLEYILIMVIFTGITLAVSRSFQDNELLKNLIATPWLSLAGMIQNGRWGSPEATMAEHPNAHAMHASMRGDQVNGGGQ